VARHFYEVLQERHGLAPAASATRNATPVEMMLARFDEHLRDDRGRIARTSGVWPSTPVLSRRLSG
jgi:hypothetical protein